MIRLRSVLAIASVTGVLSACAHRPPARAAQPSTATPGAPSSQAPAWHEAPHDQRNEDNQKIDAASHGS